jgi:two-component system repressor protein LuxO
MAMQRRSDGKSQVLLIDRDPGSAQAVHDMLAQSFLPVPELVLATGGRQGADKLRDGSFELVLADLASVGDLAERGDEAVARLVRLAEGALVIALSEDASVSAVAAMRSGAHDFVAKPINPAALAGRTGELAQRHGKGRAFSISHQENTRLSDFGGFIGASSAMQFIYEQITRIAASSAPVFITGESGTGKEVCAEALHGKGPRAGKRLVAINCAAIPRDLMESELFGVARGAFTGAHEDRKGAAELADGGTLFLDEVGEMDLSLQSKLLRFLQTGTISRVGESQVRRVDVRVICATNRNPMQLIAARKFREDLFYRLHVLPIHLPPLRQRPSDIMALASAFLERFASEERKHYAGEAAAQLTAGEWPGNVRQLQNLVRRLVVMFDGGKITAEMLSAADIEGRSPSVLEEPVRRVQRRAILPMWQQEQQIIEDAIASFNGNVSLAAAALEISPSTIYRKRQSWAGITGVAS